MSNRLEEFLATCDLTKCFVIIAILCYTILWLPVYIGLSYFDMPLRPVVIYGGISMGCYSLFRYCQWIGRLRSKKN